MIRDLGFKKAEDFYLALGSGKIGTGQVVNKVLQRLKTDEVDDEPVITIKPASRKRIVTGDSLGVVVPGVDDVLVRLAKCCTPVPGDEIQGYISLGRGITIHRADCPNVKALMRNPERFTPVEWEAAPAPRASASRSRSRRGIARACSRTSPGRSPSTARTSSPTAAPSRTGWPATGTPPSSAT